MNMPPDREDAEAGGAAAPDEPVRINRYLASCGVASRRGADDLVRTGRVRVGGEVVGDLSLRVTPGVDLVTLDGREVRPAARTLCYMINKPPGYDVTTSDPHSRKNIYSLLPRDAPRDARAVGRLDRPTTGLLLVTNDGDLAHRLTHPRFGVEKEYHAFGPYPPTPDQIRRLLETVHLDDGPARAIRADTIASPSGEVPGMRLVIHMGRKRVVRRMCKAVRFDLRRLHRHALGPLTLGDLPMGRCRELTAKETTALRAAVGL